MTTPSQPPPFHEAKTGATLIRDLGLKIAGTKLEPVIKEFESELEGVGLRRVQPRFYLSAEWGVPFGTLAIAIPFYLARPDLTSQYAENVGYIEGEDRSDILRYLRHEMGHVVNYAYQLFNDEKWVQLFGSIAQPYKEEYRAAPFSHRFVRHLPGWYAQKHPDEDWAETFAVWMTPDLDWRKEYADWPSALAKLEYCQRTVAEIRDRDPAVRVVELDDDVDNLGYSLESYYRGQSVESHEPLPRLDGDLRTIFHGSSSKDGSQAMPSKAAADLIRRTERELTINVYRWTGHFPERTRNLLRHLARCADQLKLTYSAEREKQVVMALVTMVTTLAMNYVHHGGYVPDVKRN
jgi:hypothetical protein